MTKVSLAGCAIVKNNKIILIRRIKTGWYELPGGKIENNETAEAAAVREIKEELCVDIKILNKLGEKDFTENGYVLPYTSFQAELKDGEDPVIGEPEKFDDIKYIELGHLRELALSPNMENFVSQMEAKAFILN